MLLQGPFPELLGGPPGECPKPSVLALAQQEDLQTSQHVGDDPESQGHLTVQGRTLTHDVIRGSGPPERPLDQEQGLNVIGDELRVLEGESERIAGPATVADHDQFLRTLAGDLQEPGANRISVPRNRLDASWDK